MVLEAWAPFGRVVGAGLRRSAGLVNRARVEWSTKGPPTVHDLRAGDPRRAQGVRGA
jgi:hypothetical protein